MIPRTAVWILLVVAAALAFGYIVIFNKLVRLVNRCDGSWADIDTQLQRRADVLPNLVETVKGYAAHERETLDAVIAARSASVSASGPAEAAAADGMLRGALGRLFALAEAYPQLRANENFLQLQGELSRLEDAIAGARQAYNAAVLDLNTQRQVFPSNLVAGSKARFAAREYFEADETAREVPKVRF